MRLGKPVPVIHAEGCRECISRRRTQTRKAILSILLIFFLWQLSQSCNHRQEKLLKFFKLIAAYLFLPDSLLTWDIQPLWIYPMYPSCKEAIERVFKVVLNLLSHWGGLIKCCATSKENTVHCYLPKKGTTRENFGPPRTKKEIFFLLWKCCPLLLKDHCKLLLC